MVLTVYGILNMSRAAQAKTWAHLEDELLLDIDLGIGRDITLTDPVRVWAASRLERAGVVVIAQGQRPPAPPSVKVSRVPLIRKAS